MGRISQLVKKGRKPKKGVTRFKGLLFSENIKYYSCTIFLCAKYFEHSVNMFSMQNAAYIKLERKIEVEKKSCTMYSVLYVWS